MFLQATIKGASTEPEIFCREQRVSIVTGQRAVDQEYFGRVKIHLFELRRLGRRTMDAKVRCLDHAGAGQKHRALYHVTQLTNISGPGISLERGDRIRVKSLDLPAVSLHQLCQEFPG